MTDQGKHGHGHDPKPGQDGEPGRVGEERGWAGRVTIDQAAGIAYVPGQVITSDIERALSIARKLYPRPRSSPSAWG